MLLTRFIRTLALWVFLIGTALALWLADAEAGVVIGVMVLALLIAWTIEWAFWHEERPRLVRVVEEPPQLPREEPVAPPPPPVAPEPPAASADDWSRWQPPVEAPPAPAPEYPPAPESAAPEYPPEPEPELRPDPEPVAAAPTPEPDPEPQPAPEPERPAPPPEPLRAVPPLPVEPPPPPPPPSSPVVPFPAAAARQEPWNLWDLERIAREESQRNPARAHEWSVLFLHLRQYAAADGSLPPEFDDLVRESFGDMMERRPGE